MLKDVLRHILYVGSTILVFFLILTIYSKTFGPLPFSVNSIVTNKSDIFSSSGNGKAEIKPDMAVIRVGVQANGTTVQQAQTDLNTAINKVNDAVKALGIKNEDIETENYNVNPNMDFREGQNEQSSFAPQNQRITGYTATSNVVIKVRDISKASQVVDTATGNGANLVGRITFDVSDKTAAINEAREEAVKEAKQNATQAAKVAGFSLGKLINYNEWIPQENIPYGIGGTELSKPDAPSTPTEIQPGSTEVIINVTLSYEIK